MGSTGGEASLAREVWATGLDRVGKYLTANVDLWPRPLVLFANGKTWAALTPAQRRTLGQAVTGDLAAEMNARAGLCASRRR